MERSKSDLSGNARFFPRVETHARFKERENLRIVVYFPSVTLRERPAMLHFDTIAFNGLHMAYIASHACIARGKARSRRETKSCDAGRVADRH